MTDSTNSIADFFSPNIPSCCGIPLHRDENYSQLDTYVNTKMWEQENQSERINKSLWICEYSADIFNTMRDTEKKRRMIFFQSHQVEYRPMLLRLLKAATEMHKLARATLHLAVYLLDCFMDNFTIRADKLHLTALTCLIIAGKIEEADPNIPKFAELNKLVDLSYSLRDFKSVEFKVLSTFHFDLIRPTTATFVEYFASDFITLEDFQNYIYKWNINSYGSSGLYPEYSSYENMLTTLGKILFEFADASLNYHKFTNTRPSILSASCIAAVRQMNGIIPRWTPYLVKLTKYNEDELAPFVEALIDIYRMHKRTEIGTNVPSTPKTAVGIKSECDSPDSGNASLTETTLNCNEDMDDAAEEDENQCFEYPHRPKRKRLLE